MIINLAHFYNTIVASSAYPRLYGKLPHIDYIIKEETCIYGISGKEKIQIGPIPDGYRLLTIDNKYREITFITDNITPAMEQQKHRQEKKSKPKAHPNANKTKTNGLLNF